MSKQVFISFSGGVESTELWRRYGKGAKAIVCDTGDEEPEMYERWDQVEAAMKIFHNGDTELIRIKPKQNAKGKEVDNLNDYAMQYGYYASPQARYCTKFFKIIPIDNFLKEQGDCILMIGLNADEENTRDGNFEKVLTVQYTYPLIDDGVTRQDCIDNLTAYGLQPNFPPYMQRGGCRKCFFRGKAEAKAKYFFNKPGFIEDMEYEQEFNRFKTMKLTKGGNRRFWGINQGFPSYESVMNECEQEIAMFGLEQMKAQYSAIKEHKTCGVFCHR